MIEKLLKDLNLYYQQGLTPKWDNGKSLAYRDAIIALQVKAGETSLPDECAANGSTGHHFTMTPQPGGTQAMACEWCGELEEETASCIGNELHNLATWLQNQSHIDPPEIEELAEKMRNISVRLWKVKS